MRNIKTYNARGHAFPFKTIIAFFIVLPAMVMISSFVAFYHYRIMPKIEARDAKWRSEFEQDEYLKEKRQIHDFLSYNLKYQYYRLQPKDEGRFFDCKWKAPDVVPQPFFAYPYLNFFNNKSTNTFTGLSIINDWPSLIHVHNIENYNHKKSKILLGIRGSDYGIHKSNLPIEMLALIKRNESFKDDLMILPDNFVFIDADGKRIETDSVQAACHNRVYDGNRYVGNTWQFFDKGEFWEKYDQIFTNEVYKNNETVYIFAYSNGSTPRYQLMKTRQEGVCKGNSIEDYMKCHKFRDNRAFRVKAIIDLETNYDTDNLKNTAMFVNQNIRGKEGHYYYAACVSKDCPVYNHEYLISLLKLKPKQMEKGFVRYQDDTERIVIDMVDYQGPIQLTHSSVIPFGIKQFEEMTKR